MSTQTTTLLSNPVPISSNAEGGKIKFGADVTGEKAVEKDPFEEEKGDDIENEDEEVEEDEDEDEDDLDSLIKGKEGKKSEEADEDEDEDDEDDTQLGILSELRLLRKENERITAEFEDFKKGSGKGNEEVEFPIQQFVTEETYDEALKSPKAFNEILMKVAQTAYSMAVEHTTRTLPPLVETQVTRKTAISNMVNSFYGRNRDLYPHRRYVASVYEEIKEKFPNLTDEDIFDKHLGGVVRKRLQLGKGKLPSKGARQVNVATPGAGNVRGEKGKGKLSASDKFAKEIEAMSKV